MAFEQNDRTVRGGTPQEITASVIRSEYRSSFTPAVRDDPRSAKELARVAEVTARQIENIRQDLSGASVPTFFALARKIPALRAIALRWLDAAQNSDPDTERLTLDLMRLMQAHYERRALAMETKGAPR